MQPCPLVEDLQLSHDSSLPVYETYWLIASSATALLASLEAGLRTHRPSRDCSLASGNKGLGPSRAGLVSPIPTVRTTPEQSSTAHLLSSGLHYPAYPTVSTLLQSNWAFRGTRPLWVDLTPFRVLHDCMLNLPCSLPEFPSFGSRVHSLNGFSYLEIIRDPDTIR